VWASVCPSVYGAAKPAFESPLVTPNTPGQAVPVKVSLTNAKRLYLIVTDGGDGFGCDWASWISPRLVGPNGTRSLTELKWTSAAAGFGEVKVNQNCSGGPLKVGGKVQENGIGTHAHSVIVFDLPAGSFHTFEATAALDDQGVSQGCGSTVKFLVYTDTPPSDVLRPTAAGEASRELADAVDQLSVAPGLEAKLFAGEPTLLSPSNIDVDHLGRVWVCEVVNYRRFANKEREDRPEGDRILVLEDTNLDGTCDKSTVFYQGRDVDSAHGVCVLGDRVIISCGDSVFSLYDRDGDLKADAGSKELLFTGIAGTQHDHGIHSFVFGPDGKLYFNFGNSGKQLKDKDGKPIVDKAGNEINDSRQPYQEGMVFRCNLDGSEVETLGWNFRNNWEVCVDSFGTLWQSDNDDDGNRGVRINYVMEFGNYGYRDELTGAGWTTPRTNLEAEIPLRHWHLNDPGVVPNLLQTGAGSPTGICLYEGTLLPEEFRNQVIHCDAGPNIVRAYVTQPAGAGYSAEVVNILEGNQDKWFRPSDVCVAPDGSLIIADWYDPGVGGHRQGDVDRGRIFRVAPPGVAYSVPAVDVSTVDGALAALRSPNHATRYMAFAALKSMGLKAVPALSQVFSSDPSPRQRARALGVLASITDSPASLGSIQNAIADRNPDLQIFGLRLLRQSTWAEQTLSRVRELMTSQSAAVRRECAIALRFETSPEKANVWAALAGTYDGEDRWFLEALGIGAGNHWDACLATYLNQHSNAAASKAGRDIIWRSRAANTPLLLAKIISDPNTPMEELPRFFRALDFLTGPSKSTAVEQLAFASTKSSPEREALVTVEALNRLPSFDARQQPDKQRVLNRAVDQLAGSAQFVTMIERFQLWDRLPEVVTMLEQQPDTSTAIGAARLLLSDGGLPLLTSAIRQSDPLKAAAVTRAVGNTGDGRSVALLTTTMESDEIPLAVRQEATKGLARTKAGVQQLLKQAKANEIAADLQQAAAFALQNAAFDEFKAEIATVYPLPPSRNDQPLPPLAQLLKRNGDVSRGKVVFNTVGKCITCHQVAGEGKEVGPNLSEIGSKLSREAMYESILYPSAGISHNFETWSAETADGNVVTGIKLSDTADEVSLRGSDALVRTLKKSEVEELVKQSISLMPADLQKTMTVEELVDVVEYSLSLKKR
jgi:putative membrane-bound dehydrogenase-like protein